MHYSTIAKLLHWGVAGLIVSQYVIAKLAENAKHNDQTLEQLALLANHKSIGITILLLAILRLLYRLKTPTPTLPSSMSDWQIKASKITHGLLYGCLFALPISGWLMSSAKSYSVSWFNLIALPDFVAPNESLAELMHGLHHYLSEALFVIALLHILAALKHHFIDKDDVLTRMSSKIGWALFIVLTLFVVAILGRLVTSTEVTQSVPKPVENSPSAEMTLSTLPVWGIDYQQSYIKFIGDQAGAPFDGEWQRWSADIQFDAEQLASSRFNVSIDPTSGFSNDQERDDTIRSPEFFDVVAFPNASFRADSFTEGEGRYQSMAKLSMKGVTVDVLFTFSVVNDNEKTVLIGSALLDRFNWNIGSGDWADTTWVGKDVKVDVRVVRKP